MAVVSGAYSTNAAGADATGTTCSHDSAATDGDDSSAISAAKCTDSRRGSASSAYSSDGASVYGDGVTTTINASTNPRACSVSNGRNITSVDGDAVAAFVTVAADTCITSSASGICI